MSFVPIRNTLLYILGKLDQVGHKSAGEFDLPRNMSLLAKVDYLPVEFFASSAYCFPFEGLFDFRSYSFGIAVVVHYAVLLRGIGLDDINTETANFTKQIYTAMESANIIKFAKRRHQLSKPWYDKDCYIMKKTTKVSLQRCRNSNNIYDRQKYIEARREYFKLLQRKRDEFNKDKNERIKNAKDPKSFWNAIASFRKKPIIQGEIDIKEWFLFYKNLLNKENKEATFTVNQMIGWKDPDLDAEITLEEIHDVVKKLANGKAVGLDGIPNELLKNLPIPTLNKLKNLFNKIMSTEKIPATLDELNSTPYI
ncbi:hypothetical protein LAZ67_5001993 [Cordylochernes scorpioides]|uniref:Uncharacterized protein n=1 Tax=Cordylochernes scorpioides TaxID=51811 RepID=A0ABY6KH49_9ARAC|nr:hypothetical protein LAZ67_5001993 [Cordylochernes scorpioides]